MILGLRSATRWWGSLLFRILGCFTCRRKWSLGLSFPCSHGGNLNALFRYSYSSRKLNWPCCRLLQCWWSDHRLVVLWIFRLSHWNLHPQTWKRYREKPHASPARLTKAESRDVKLPWLIFLLYYKDMKYELQTYKSKSKRLNTFVFFFTFFIQRWINRMFFCFWYFIKNLWISWRCKKVREGQKQINHISEVEAGVPDVSLTIMKAKSSTTIIPTVCFNLF